MPQYIGDLIDILTVASKICLYSRAFTAKGRIMGVHCLGFGVLEIGEDFLWNKMKDNKTIFY